jgi:hypothetical protein
VHTIVVWVHVLSTHRCEDEDRCAADSYQEAIDILWNIQICFVLFALANLIKSIVAKFLSTAFYRTAHFKKLQDAIGKEHFLQVGVRELMI